ncbi:MAG: sulfurtransferase [Rhodospirillales bacterium]|nr:sulfurtransferase [Rhodospirillales bacterium]
MKKNEQTQRAAKYLVETDWLAQNLDDASLRVFDCTVNFVPNPDAQPGKEPPFMFESGRANFDAGHIPGAGFIDVMEDISDKSSALPLMMPPAEEFVQVLSKLGVDNKSRVVLYSTASPMWAARVWWMLQAVGFESAILNGGWDKWTAEVHPVSTNPCKYFPGFLTVKSVKRIFAEKEDVLSAINDDNACIINALPPEMHNGTGDVVFGRKGRIAGSINVPMGKLHDPDTGVYLPVGQLREIFDAVDVDDADKIITYCGGGIASANNAFVLSMLGYKNVAVYDGSMFEWGNNEQLPMETG